MFFFNLSHSNKEKKWLFANSHLCLSLFSPSLDRFDPLNEATVVNKLINLAFVKLFPFQYCKQLFKYLMKSFC